MVTKFRSNTYGSEGNQGKYHFDWSDNAFWNNEITNKFLNEVSIELNGLIKFYIFELFIREHKKQDQSLAIIHFIKYN